MFQFSHKKMGEILYTLSMKRFFDFINDEFIDMPLCGSKYMWSNDQERKSMSRIDWFLVTKGWEEHYASAIQLALPRGC